MPEQVKILADIVACFKTLVLTLSEAKEGLGAVMLCTVGVSELILFGGHLFCTCGCFSCLVCICVLRNSACVLHSSMCLSKAFSCAVRRI